jgi:hypothetical protein
MRHRAGNMLKWQAYCEKIGALPRNAMECGKFDAYLETIVSLPGFGMAPVRRLSYSSDPNMRARRTKPCSVRGRIDLIPPKGLPRLQTCHHQRSSLPVVPPNAKRVLGAVTRLTGINSSLGRSTTEGISTYGVRVIWWSPILSTPVRSVARTFTRTASIWRPPAVSTPTA